MACASCTEAARQSYKLVSAADSRPPWCGCFNALADFASSVPRAYRPAGVDAATGSSSLYQFAA